jgi:hypothetical protein
MRLMPEKSSSKTRDLIQRRFFTTQLHQIRPAKAWKEHQQLVLASFTAPSGILHMHRLDRFGAARYIVIPTHAPPALESGG